ncbi:hypothetical protein Tco_1163659 [Tanacetum coccineum]
MGFLKNRDEIGVYIRRKNRNSSSPERVNFVNTNTILSKEDEPRKTGIVKPDIKDNDHGMIVEVKESKDEGEDKLKYTNPPSPPDPSISLITEKNDGYIMFVELIKNYDDSSEEELGVDENVATREELLPPEVYVLVSNHKVAKELWERIQLLMQGTSLMKQERECKLYDEFDKFAYKKGKTLRDFYLRFSLLLNDMNIYNMKLEQFQVNTKFLNTLPHEWRKFVTDVKLVWDLHTTNIDHLHAYLGKHEFHANEVRLMHVRNSDLLALVATYQMTQSPYQTHQNSYQNT